MWNCNWGFPYHFGFFGTLFNILLVVAIVYIVVQIVRPLFAGSRSNRDTNDSLAIIKRKYARGELDEVEYQRMKELLQS